MLLIKEHHLGVHKLKGNPLTHLLTQNASQRFFRYYLQHLLKSLRKVHHKMGLDMKAAAKALVTFHGQRQQMHTLKSCTLIDDTYNASPDSMKASVSVLSSMEGVKGRRIAALADMLELGEKEREYHYEVGKFIAGTQVDEVAAYGELFEEILKGVSLNISSF